MGVTFAFLSPTTIIIVVIVALLVFGPHKMPELMRQLGQALREFKKMTGDVQNVFSLDDHLSYDRYDPPSYSYSHPTTHYEPLDQYQPEPEDEVKALPALEDSNSAVKTSEDTATETAEATGEAAPEKNKRKRALRQSMPRKKKVETEVAQASTPEETIHTSSSETTEDKE